MPQSTFLTKKIIAVDLDGTLIQEESHRVMWRYLWKYDFWSALQTLGIFIREGSAAFKSEILQRCPAEKFSWHFHEPLLKELKKFSSEDYAFILITGAPLEFAQNIADQTHFFCMVLGSTRKNNLVGHHKLKALDNVVGHRKYIYVGNSLKDFQIWRYIESPWIVRPSLLVRFCAKFFLKTPLFIN